VISFKRKRKKQLGIIILYVVSGMHMNLWSYNKRKVGDTICTPPPPPPILHRKVSKTQREGGKKLNGSQRGERKK